MRNVLDHSAKMEAPNAKMKMNINTPMKYLFLYYFPVHPPRVVGELCAETYKTSCENFGVTPQKAVLKSFSTSALNVNHRELGPRATGALAKALSVRTPALYI